MNMLVFDKSFDVELIRVVDESIEGSIIRRVCYKVNGEVYRYTYSGNKLMATSSVVNSNGKEIYSSWKHIPNGSYYNEIGRRLSVNNRRICSQCGMPDGIHKESCRFIQNLP